MGVVIVTGLVLMLVVGVLAELAHASETLDRYRR